MITMTMLWQNDPWTSAYCPWIINSNSGKRGQLYIRCVPRVSQRVDTNAGCDINRAICNLNCFSTQKAIWAPWPLITLFWTRTLSVSWSPRCIDPTATGSIRCLGCTDYTVDVLITSDVTKLQNWVSWNTLPSWENKLPSIHLSCAVYEIFNPSHTERGMRRSVIICVMLIARECEHAWRKELANSYRALGLGSGPGLSKKTLHKIDNLYVWYVALLEMGQSTQIGRLPHWWRDSHRPWEAENITTIEKTSNRIPVQKNQQEKNPSSLVQQKLFCRNWIHDVMRKHCSHGSVGTPNHSAATTVNKGPSTPPTSLQTIVNQRCTRQDTKSGKRQILEAYFYGIATKGPLTGCFGTNDILNVR